MEKQVPLEYANIVGWLTRRDSPETSLQYDLMDQWLDLGHMRGRWAFRNDAVNEVYNEWMAPRLPLHVLRRFLDVLPWMIEVNSLENHDESLHRLIDKCQNIINDLETVEGILPSTSVARALAPLRRWFIWPIYFLSCGAAFSSEQTRTIPPYALWLRCSDARAGTVQQDLFDPFPPLRQLFTGLRATACWTSDGDSIIIPDEVMPPEELLRLSAEIPPWRLLYGLRRSLRRSHWEPEHSFNLLQLSDLHFGASAVTNLKMAYVEQYIRDRIEHTREAGGIVQPVITGDLMDTPSRKNLEAFEAFRNRLTDCAKMSTICIPGNHDMRKKGFLWRNWEALAGIEWKSVVASDQCKIIFVCFNTSKDAKLAQGKITDDQFLEVSTKLLELKRLGNYSDYMCVALVHHHPFSTREDEFDTLPYLGIREERFLRMENGGRLIEWCASNSIPLILHGHKHRPRFIGQEIIINGNSRLVRAIGCGSSFGIEGKPLSFNWITWQPQLRQWSVIYYADPGDGSGFRERRLVIGPS